MNQSHANKILIVDDEPVARQTLGALLESYGYQLGMAENGLEGVQKAREMHPDVILLDVMMPIMDGFEVCRRLRADPEVAEVPIILITALDDRDSRLAGLEAGADDFLAKPFDSLELTIRLNTLRRVDRYRRLVEEREKLKLALAELSEKNRQLRVLSRQVLTAQENERRRLAVELHDEVGQLITALKLILEQQAGQPGQAAPAWLAEARAITNDLFRDVREMSLNLRPTVLDDFGLSAALDWLVRRFTSQTQITIYHNINPLDERRFDKTVETAIFRISQEALTNIARYAGVTEASLLLVIEPEHLQISISDAGQGFDRASLPPGQSSGLSGMEERATLAGGSFNLQSTPGEGTLVLADFNLTTEN